jgi:hypothetical protein
MKRTEKVAWLLVGFAMSVGVAAAAANKESFHIQSPTMVGATQLPAGEYTVQWEGGDPVVELKLLQGKRVKATASAKVMPLDRAFTENATLVHTDGDGGRRLLEIRFSSKKFFLLIEPYSGDMNAASREHNPQ